MLCIRPDFDKVNQGQLDDHTFKSQGDGISTPWKITGQPKRTLTLPFYLKTEAECKDFRMIFNNRRGRRLGFYVPTWLNDFRLSRNATAGDTVIYVIKTGLDSAFDTFPNYPTIAMATQTKLECYTVSGVATSGEEEVIMLTSGLLTDAVANQTICCGLLFARFATDKLEFQHYTSAVASITATFTELPTEYPTALAGSQPRFFYRFTRSGVVYTLTSWMVDLVSTDGSPINWIASDIIYSNLTSAQDLLGSAVVLNCSTDDDQHPLRYFKDRLSTERVEVEIFMHDPDLDGALTIANMTLLYKGEVATADLQAEGVMTINCTSAMRIAERQFPAINTERTCVLETYGPESGIVEADFTTSGLVTAINAAYVEATEFGDKATAESDPNWFALGRVTIGLETRQVMGQSGNRLLIAVPFKQTINIGDAVVAVAGDDKRIATWRDKFNAEDNWLGFHLMPNTNPQFAALATPQPAGGKKA